MDSDMPGPRRAALSFATALLANRRVAGVAAAARAARELIDCGYEHISLVVLDGGTLDAAAWRDLGRLSGGASVAVVDRDEMSGSISPAPRLSTSDVLKSTGKQSDGLVSRYLNRPISRGISALLLNVPGLRPLHATLGTAVIALAMFAVLLFGGARGLVAGGLLFQAASIFDGVDGEVARATYRASATGATLDSAVDMMTNFMFVVGLTADLAATNGRVALALGSWALLLLAMGFWLLGRRTRRDEGQLRFEWLKQNLGTRLSAGPMSGLGSVATFLTTRDSIAFFFMVMTLAGRAMIGLCVLALAATIWIVVLLFMLAIHPPARTRGVAPRRRARDRPAA
jgi:phosphatidylglycerophosphate synthase